MTPETRPEEKPAPEQLPAALSSADDRRVQARRRFLRMGAGGTAALVVTVTHKRAFAGIKKNVVASNCASAQGVPDLKHANKKKALETSAMGTPKGLICRPRDEVVSCNQYDTGTSQYYRETPGTVPPYSKQLYVKSNSFKDGCGDIDKTLEMSHNYRLYEKGYCPLKYDANGLYYDLTAVYYKEKDGQFIRTMCESPPR